MATDIYATEQSTGETRVHYVDFTNDLPSGVTVTAGSVSLSQYPQGGTATVTVGAASSNVLPVTVSGASATGVYCVDVRGTLSDGEVSIARLVIPMKWASIRAGMVDLLLELRGLTDAGYSDYTVGGVSYWTDKHLQDLLDAHKTIFDYEPLAEFAQRAGTAYEYKLFDTGYKNFEGTALIMDEDGGTISSGFSFDWRLGRVTFTADQAGSARTFSGTVYDIYAAAADVWRRKASYYAAAYDVSTDNHNLSRSQLLAHAKGQESYYRSLSGSPKMGGQGGAVTAERGDC